MKILVCGGRDYTNIGHVHAVLGCYSDIEEIITGGASGADYCAMTYAIRHDIFFVMHNADWKKYGSGAGPIRNKDMLDTNPEIDLVIAFPGGRGTANMIRNAKAVGITISEFSQ